VTVRLEPLAAQDFERVSHLVVAPEQERFSGTVADAFATGEALVDFHAIRLDQTIVGFFKIDRDYAASHHFAAPDEVGLRAFLIDLSQQGKGIATAAVRALRPYLQARYPTARSVVLTVNMSNPAAKACYRNGGFRDTSEIYEGGIAGPQLVMRMSLVG